MPRVRPSRTLCLALCACVVGASAGCSSGPKDFDNDNDALRRERESLLKENARLLAELTEARAKLNEIAMTGRLADGANAEEVARAVPRCAGLSYGRLTNLVDEDGVPGPEAIDVYLRPFDGRQRFIQIAGWLTIRADLLPEPDPAAPDAAAPPELLGTLTLDPEQVREAYRSSMLGTHYSLRVTLLEPNRVLNGSVVLVTSFRDAQTGRRHRAQHTLHTTPAP